MINSGFILLDKKPGVTSFEALWDVKRALGTGKVGHTGTLDKFAQGLLVVLTGKALKLTPWFSRCHKKYKGRIHFGIETDTLDPEGKPITEAPIPTRQAVENILINFTGIINQEPPVYSAIHVNGKRASELARSGMIPEMKKRQVNIYSLELLSWEPPFADIFVHCSSGTYIRSLTRDIALAAGSRAHLNKLTRTHVAEFKLTDANKDHFEINPINKDITTSLGLSNFEVTSQEAEKIFHGKPLQDILKDKPLTLPDTSSAIVFSGETLIAIVERTEGKWKYGCVFS